MKRYVFSTSDRPCDPQIIFALPWGKCDHHVHRLVVNFLPPPIARIGKRWANLSEVAVILRCGIRRKRFQETDEKSFASNVRLPGTTADRVVVFYRDIASEP
ncbi:MAG: hypothetical protein D6741_02490 [Planctomycetota bacterium]|nr:MAG: hypothetical protein D6741_02490 [Planctomycetota bacterium]